MPRLINTIVLFSFIALMGVAIIFESETLKILSVIGPLLFGILLYLQAILEILKPPKEEEGEEEEEN